MSQEFIDLNGWRHIKNIKSTLIDKFFVYGTSRIITKKYMYVLTCYKKFYAIERYKVLKRENFNVFIYSISELVAIKEVINENR